LTDRDDEAKSGVMTSGEPVDKASLTVRVPDHVVFREFVNETVVLNLETGMYHGLNPTGGRMLETLAREATVDDAALALAGFYGLDVPAMRADLAQFCEDLEARGLIVLER